MNILVTGAKGFIGKNLVVALRRRKGTAVWEFDKDSGPETLSEVLSGADVVFHLAGVNRPERVEEFNQHNTELTSYICDGLRRLKRKAALVLASSSQALLDNPYGVSKREAEEVVFHFGAEANVPIAVFRFPGVFGKWCRPNYNSVVATFCHNIARDLPITISDPDREVELVYIDDVVASFMKILDGEPLSSERRFLDVEPLFRLTLGKLSEIVRDFRQSRRTLLLPDFSDRLMRYLYATYLSYLPEDDFSYELKQNVDERGELAELLKSQHIGQIFLSRTRPGIARGHHYHDTKVEKFVVIEGDAVIRFKSIISGEIVECPVSGHEFRVVDIPPGYSHSIENIGKSDLIVLFWVSEIFDPTKPDTYALKVIKDK